MEFTTVPDRKANAVRTAPPSEAVGLKSDQPKPASSPGKNQLDNSYYFNQGTADAIELSGTCAAIRNGGVDIPATYPGPRTFEERVQVLGEDGRTWYFWGEDPFDMRATRPRTDSERERFIDSINQRITCSWFSKDRLEICRQIGYEMTVMAQQAKPDSILSRSKRRANQKKITALGVAQWQLTSLRECDMRKIRANLAAVGVVIAVREV